MATLFNTKISDTYEGLIKTSNNGVIGAVEQNLTDGSGNASTLSIGTSSASFTGTLDLTNATVVGLPSGAVDSVNGQTGVVVLTTTNINEGTNLYFTDARVEANSAVTLNTAKVTFPEAPNDGQQYARQSQSWTVVSGGGAVDSVNGQTGVVVLDTDNITEGTTNLYYTDARVDANSNVAANTAKVGITPTQANEIAANTLKVGISTQQANDITANNAKISFDSASSTKLNGIEAGAEVNTVDSVNGLTGAVSLGLLELDDVGADGSNGQVLTTNGSGSFTFTTVAAGGAVDSVNGQTGTVTLDTDNISEGTTNLYYTDARVSANSSVAANTAKVGITSQQATDITNNNAKVGITTSQANEIAANTLKVGITPTQASDITTNNAKVGITTQQASDITTNNAKVGITIAQANEIAANTLKVGITAQQASDITNNNTKISFTSTGTDNYLSKWDSNTLIDSLIYDDGTNIQIGTTTASDKLSVASTVGILGDTTNQGLLKLYCEDSSHYVGIKGGVHSGGSSYTLQLPNALPNVANQILESNGSGTLSWIATPSGGGGGATDLNGLSDVLIDGTSAYFVNIPSNLSGNPTDNLVIGDNAGNSLTTGKRNVILGSQAAPATTSGSYQVIIGWNAGLSTTSNGSSVIIGYDAGKLVNANTSVMIGAKAARSLSGSYGFHTIVGGNACYLTSSGNYHSAFGYGALFLQTTGSRQTAIGYRSLYSLSTANDNTALGYQSGYSITGSGNTVIGSNSAYSGTNNLTSGSNNILIGHNSAASAATVSNEITLGNSSISTLRCAVTSITSLSDERDKSNIKDLSYGLDFIDSLQPREFVWDNRLETKLQQVKDENGDDVFDENNEGVFEEVEFYSNNKGKKDFGFIAQEVQSLDDDTLRLVYDKNPEKLEISYGKLVPILVKAIQELKAEIETLK